MRGRKRRSHKGFAGQALNFDKGTLGVECGFKLLPARIRRFRLQLRPFQVTDGTRAIGPFGCAFGLQQLRQHIRAKSLDFDLRGEEAAMCVHQRRVQRQAARLALDLQRRQLGLRRADRRLRSMRRAPRARSRQ